MQNDDELTLVPESYKNDSNFGDDGYVVRNDTRPQLSGNMGNQPQQNEAQPSAIAQMFKQSAHPYALFFHLLFRVLAIVTYILSGLIFGNASGGSFITTFVCVTLLLAFDFWTVKNVSGRLLVGLRWWNDVDEHGNSKWIFESKYHSDSNAMSGSERYQPNSTDYRVFWWSLHLTSAAWIILGLVALIKFSISWLLLIALALALNSANTVGYTKCDREAKEKFLGVVNRGGMIGRVFGMFTSRR